MFTLRFVDETCTSGTALSTEQLLASHNSFPFFFL